MFRLRPNPLTSQIFLYALALAAEKTGVAVHAVCVMSDHHHVVVTDTAGRLPEFLAELHRTTAKALNAAQGQWESLWSSEHCHAAIVADDVALLDRIAYTVVNPVAAGLVARPEDWPGVSLWEPKELEIARPLAFFDPHGKCPEVARVRIVQPATPAISYGDWRARLAYRIWQRVLAAHRKTRRARRTFLGRAAVMAQSIMKRAISLEPKRRHLASVAAADPVAQKRALSLLKVFRLAYRDARDLWCAGDRDVRFPLGTWGMRRDHAVALVSGDDPMLRIAA